MALWRQETALHPTFASINGCLKDDWFLLPFELRLQKAHALTLEAAGILSARERVDVERALQAIHGKYAQAACPDDEAEDIHTWIEQQLTARIGDAGKKVHTARSRNDQVATLLVMFLIDAGQGCSAELGLLIERCCRRATEWSDLPMPLHTHTQLAAPGNVGFWLLRYATALQRAREHLQYYLASWRRHCPLGSGAVAGSSIPIDRRIQAADLGFDGPSPNALDSTGTRDPCLEFLFVATQIALHLQAFAADVILFSQTTLRWATYPRSFGTGSSMMPNKINPDAMELLRGRCNAFPAAMNQAILLLKGLPSGYNRDLQCIKPLVRDAAGELRALLAMTEAFLGELQFDASRLAEDLQHGHLDATYRMEQQVLRGTPLRDAHHAVAADLAAKGPGASAEAFDPATYQTIGGASPAETRRVAGELLSTLSL
ncbi:MAG: argininosuccinate lyase [Planctomycetota bacterium]